MIALIDTSVILRRLFDEPGQLREWSKIKQGYASRLLPIELGRVIDRYRLLGTINDAEVVQLHEQSQLVLRSISLVALTDAILDRAASAMPTVIGSLDAIHLATALELKRALVPKITVATHDAQLAQAARACGFVVVGA
jgi:predicted nucleic acid-binding protein